MNKLLRITRIAVSLIIFLIITAALTATPLAIPGVAQWLQHIQFLPAVLSFSLAIFIGWLIITLIFGRIYCSTVCPVGTLQDIFARIRLKIRPKDYHYAPPAGNTRYLIVLIVLACLMAGAFILPSILDPYSAYARICNRIFTPLYTLLFHSPATEQAPGALALKAFTGAAASVIAIITLLAIAAVSATKGRLICNTVCPVGTTLGLVGRFAIFQIEIDTDKCIQCRHCEHVCKSACIDMNDHVVDGSRCVNCFNCINVCPNDAIHYTSRRKQLSIPMMQSLKDIKRVPEASIESPNSPCKKNQSK